jgi:hypothetical protein
MANWISTYSIKAGVSSLEISTIYSFLFWLTNCICTFVWMYVPGTVNERMGMGLRLAFIAMIVTVFFQYLGLYRFVCIFAPISSGILISGIFGFGISLPVANGFLSSPQNNANFILSNAFGEGLLIMPMGYSMIFFGYEAFMIEICVFAGMEYWIFGEVKKSMSEDMKTYEEQLVKGKQL